VVVDLIGTTLDNYEILTEIASGGMAIVYHARQPVLDRDVAIKILKVNLAQDPKNRERFVREAKAAAQLRHPNILTIYDAKWNSERNVAWIAMEYVPGGTLKDLMVAPMPLEKILPLVEQISAALHYAHGRGVIHRDIKPSNILLDKNDRILIADFGLASIVGGDTQLTGEGEVLGTPDYMAPEQIEGAPVDARADIYSLGVVAYEMITGRLPYQAETPIAVMLKRITEAPSSPRTWRLDLPAAVESVILKAMARTPADRFSDVQTFSQALKTAIQTEPSFPHSTFLSRKDRKMPLHSGDILAEVPCKIVDYLGEGFWGIVYLADHQRVPRQLAIKLLRDEIANDPDEVRRFKQERDISVRIDLHPNIIYVYDFIEDEAGVGSYMVMEYADGGSLKKYLPKEQKKLQPLDIVRFGLDLCQAVEAIQEKNILHLDLKPDNIMLKIRLGRLTAKVSDFGIAIDRSTKAMTGLPAPMPTGYYRGNPTYTSPEQLASKTGADLDGRADLYSLGAILYEIATGFPPFLGDAKPLEQCIMEDLPIPPTERNPSIPEDLERVILRALHKKREERFHNAREMFETLQQVERDILARKNKFDRLFNEAKVVFEQGKWAEALDKFKALPVTSNHPEREVVEHYIDNCHKFIELEANYQKAKEAQIAKDLPIVVKLLQEITQIAPDYRDGEANQELEQALRRLEASQEFQKGLDFIDQQEWQQALDQLNVTKTRFPDLINEGDVLEEIDHLISNVQRKRREAGLYQRFQNQLQIAGSTMTPESWQQAVQISKQLVSLALDSTKYQKEVAETEQQLNLATLYAQAISVIAVGDWPKAVEVYQEIRRISRNYRDVAAKLVEAEERVKCQKLRQEVAEDLGKEDWLAAMEKVQEICSILPDDQEVAKLSKELAVWLEVLKDEAAEAWSKGIEKLKTLTHPLLINRAADKMKYLKLHADLAEHYKSGKEHYQADEWCQALPVFQQINNIAQINHIAPYKDAPKLLGELKRRALLDKMARWSSRNPHLIIILIGVTVMLLIVASAWASRFLIAPPTPPTMQIGSLEAMRGAKMTSGSLQTIAKGDRVEITVQARDKTGKFLVHDAITCYWSFIPTPEPMDFKTQDDCTIKYQMPSSLKKQALRVRVEGKEDNFIIGISTMTINFALAEE
jgi:serine/threonine protein kinase